MGRCKPLGSLNSFLSYAPQLPEANPVSLITLRSGIFATCIPPAPQQSPWGVAASTGSQFWEPSFTFEGQRSLMALTFFVYWYGRRYFHFTVWCLSFFNCCCSVARLCLTLWPHGLQHARLPCPSLSPGACSNSCPLSQWCHPTISSSVIHLSSCFQFLLASGPFLMSRLFKIN